MKKYYAWFVCTENRNGERRNYEYVMRFRAEDSVRYDPISRMFIESNGRFCSENEIICLAAYGQKEYSGFHYWSASLLEDHNEFVLCRSLGISRHEACMVIR